MWRTEIGGGGSVIRDGGRAEWVTGYLALSSSLATGANHSRSLSASTLALVSIIARPF